jgi:hypothetical protein
MRFVTLPRAYFYLAGHRMPLLSPEGEGRLRFLSAWQALRRQGLSSTWASPNQAISLPEELGMPR